MKVTTKDLGDRQALLTIEVDSERVEKALRGVARRVSKDYRIPGFRRGRAPYRVILQRFGRETLLQEVIDELGQEVIEEAIEDQDLDIYGLGALENMELDPLVLQVRVSLRPVVDLGDYRELRVEPPDVEVDGKEVDAELEKLREANAILEPAEDRPTQMGDRVSLSVGAQLLGEESMEEEEIVLLLDAEDDEIAPGFAEKVVGMEPGEERHFTLTLPQEEEEGDAREASFSVTLHEVRNRILPDVDDDLARTVGGFDTLEALQEDIRQRLAAQAQSKADQAYANNVVDALVEQATIQYPPDMIEDQIDNMIDDLEQRLESQNLPLDDYLKLSGQTEDTLRESLRPRAVESTRRGLALGELARREGLEVEEHEVHQRIDRLSAVMGARAAEFQRFFSSPEGMRSLFHELLTDKAVQRMVAIAKGEAPPLEEKEEADQGPEDESSVAVEVEKDESTENE